MKFNNFDKKYKFLSARCLTYNTWAISDKNKKYIGNINCMYGTNNLNIEIENFKDISTYLKDIEKIAIDFEKYRESKESGKLFPLKFKFFWKNKEIQELEEQIKDLNTMSLFNRKDREILNPVYAKDLKQLKNKVLPFGFYIKGWIV